MEKFWDNKSWDIVKTPPLESVNFNVKKKTTVIV